MKVLLHPQDLHCLDHHITIFFTSTGDHRCLHSFPTRRSSDLRRRLRPGARLEDRRPCLRDAPSAPRTANRSARDPERDRKSTRLNSSHPSISYAVFCLKKKIGKQQCTTSTHPPPLRRCTRDRQ